MEESESEKSGLTVSSIFSAPCSFISFRCLSMLLFVRCNVFSLRKKIVESEGEETRSVREEGEEEKGKWNGKIEDKSNNPEQVER